MSFLNRQDRGGSRYLCPGVAGYDGPTGLGTPNGTTAFTNVAAEFSRLANLEVAGNSSVNDTLTLAAINGYYSPVQLSISGLPPGSSRLTLRARTSMQ